MRSLRELARDANTTTRAVNTLIGSEDGLLGALGVRAFDYLRDEINALPETSNPLDDLVEVALIFRRSALGRPALFSIAFHRADPPIWPRFLTAAADAIAVLDRRFERLAADGLLGGRSIAEASTQFRALGAGVAWAELRGNPLPPDPEASGAMRSTPLSRALPLPLRPPTANGRSGGPRDRDPGRTRLPDGVCTATGVRPARLGIHQQARADVDRRRGTGGRPGGRSASASASASTSPSSSDATSSRVKASTTRCSCWRRRSHGVARADPLRPIPLY